MYVRPGDRQGPIEAAVRGPTFGPGAQEVPHDRRSPHGGAAQRQVQDCPKVLLELVGFRGLDGQMA
jgi:hypothetical protein